MPMVTLTRTNGQPIAVEPTEVSAVFYSYQQEGTVVVRMKRGSGFLIRGTYEEVMRALGYEVSPGEEAAVAASEDESETAH